MENEAIKAHKKTRGKWEISSKVKINSSKDLSLYYSPGVGDVSRAISKNPELTNVLTNKKNTIAIVSDGSAVLGLGNIGPEAALPVMEGKAILFKEFGEIDAIPIVLNTNKTSDIIKTIVNISPSFGGINLEDISAPRCISIERELKSILKIPVFHDDQHGTSIVITAAIINALRLTAKKAKDLNVIVIGLGAAGTSITRMIKKLGVRSIIAYDIDGFVNDKRKNNFAIDELLNEKILDSFYGSELIEGFKDKDLMIGVAKGNIVSEEMIKKMNKNPWVFPLANPDPEIIPEKAKKAGAYIIGTGRSDYPNQVNNLLAFPGLFRGVVDAGIVEINQELMMEVASAISYYIKDSELSRDYILPSNLNKDIPKMIAKKIMQINEKCLIKNQK